MMWPERIVGSTRETIYFAVAVVSSLLLTYVLLVQRQQSPQVVHIDVSLTDFHSLYAKDLAHAKYIDLTHTIKPNMPLWSGFNQPTMGGSPSKLNGEVFEYGKDGFIATSVTLPTDQLGTQLDPPAHWNEYGATISDLPPTVALRPLVLIDLSAKPPGYHATVADVKEWEASYGRVPAGSAVLFRSDWSKLWDTYGASAGPDVFPGVGLDALKFLHLARSILVHGHEPLDTDMTPTLEGEAWLLHNNFMQFEGVANLDKLPASGCLLSIGAWPAGPAVVLSCAVPPHPLLGVL